MAARKTTRKASGTRKAATKKAPAAKKKPAAKKASAAQKKPAAKKAPASKKASPAKKAPAAKKATPKKATPAKAEAGNGGAEQPAAKGVPSTAVNMGNLFALRPRVSTSFRQEDFLTARRLLEEEPFASLEEAARAVAKRALELSNDPKGRPGQKRGR